MSNTCRDVPRRAAWIPLFAALVAAIGTFPAPRAEAATTCATAISYARCGRVFPDPQGGLPTDPFAEGLVQAGDFLQFGDPSQPAGSELWNGLKFLESRYADFLEVWTLEDLLGEPDAKSAGLWLAGQRQRLPLILVRVTDERVAPDDKQRFAFGLSLHGIERAGAEGGTRAIEDLATYAWCESLGSLTAALADPICSLQTQVRLGAFRTGVGGFPARLLPWDRDSLTMGQTLQTTELYFTYNNPDGWHRGDRVGGVSHFQRYNGNGVDPNRDWPTVGYTFWGYTPGSEPETKYVAEALKSISDDWAGGIDLHGQGNAPVLTYTMLPAGQHDYRKNQRIRAVAQRTQHDASARLLWSPLIKPYEHSGPAPNVPQVGGSAPMFPQQWGTVWDSIGYTTTGSYGDWINSPDVGLGGIGLGNEMSLSHITNCGNGSCYSSDVEQLHVAGNKGLIYTQIDTVVRTDQTTYRFPFFGRGAYLAYDNVLENPGSLTGLGHIALDPQAPIAGSVPCNGGCVSPTFEVLGPTDAGNGGMTVNIGYPAPYNANDALGSDFRVQHRAVDGHVGEAEWEDVGWHYNEGQLYATNGATITVNAPLPGSYRIVMSPHTPGVYTYEVAFSRRQAHMDPGQRPYRVSNLDFFDELNSYLPRANRLEGITADDVIDDPAVLDDLDVFVLADEYLDGWNEGEGTPAGRSRAEHKAFTKALTAFVNDGGTLVLLDAALAGMPALMNSERFTPKIIQGYAGNISFQNSQGITYDDPLAKDINVPGAAEGPQSRHQTYEPVPLGYRISAETVGFPNSAPMWILDDRVVEETGGRVAGRSSGRWKGVADALDASLGEIPMGKGRIRFAGALLPNPTEEFDHPFGLASYALTYTGWQLFENLLQTKVSVQSGTKPIVLSDRVTPETGWAPPLLWFLLLAIPAVWLARKLRDSYWV